MNQEQETAESPAAEPPDVPPVPRPLTRRAARRSWNEMSVRVWMVLTFAVALVCGYFAVTRVHEALTDRWLIEHGTPVVAKLGRTGGNVVPKRQPRNESLPSELIFELDGRRHAFNIRLEPRTGAFAQEGMEFPIRVDPDNPARWTEETIVKPWSQELTVIFFLTPVLVLVAAVTWWKRQRVLGIWRDGALASATVVDVRQTAVAPLSRVVRFTLDNADDRRVWATLMPTSAGIPSRGQTLWLLRSPGNPGRTVVPGLYM